MAITIERIKSEIKECRSVAGWNGHDKVYKVFHNGTLIAVVEYRSYAAPYEGGYIEVDVSPRYTLPCPAYSTNWEFLEKIGLTEVEPVYEDNALAIYGDEAEVIVVKSYSGESVKLHLRTGVDTPLLTELFRRYLEKVNPTLLVDLTLEMFRIRPAEKFEPEIHRIMTCRGEKISIAGVTVYDMGRMVVNGEERHVAVVPVNPNPTLEEYVLRGLFGKEGFFRFGNSQRKASVELLFLPEDREEAERIALDFITNADLEVRSGTYPWARPCGGPHGFQQ